MFTVILEGLEFANLVYKGKEGVDAIMEYVQGPVFIRYFVLQFGFGALLPIAIMSLMIALKTRGRAFVVGATVCGLLVLMNVMMMRWNVVIGGQEISKSTRGLLSYPLHWWGRESLASAVILLLAPFGLLWLLVRLFPPWADPPKLQDTD